VHETSCVPLPSVPLYFPDSFVPGAVSCPCQPGPARQMALVPLPLSESRGHFQIFRSLRCDFKYLPSFPPPDSFEYFDVFFRSCLFPFKITFRKQAEFLSPCFRFSPFSGVSTHCLFFFFCTQKSPSAQVFLSLLSLKGGVYGHSGFPPLLVFFPPCKGFMSLLLGKFPSRFWLPPRDVRCFSFLFLPPPHTGFCVLR